MKHGVKIPVVVERYCSDGGGPELATHLVLKSLREAWLPRLCYPVISQAKDLGKGVIVHLHDYQPISYERRITSTGRTCIERNTVKN